jgi:long-chain acyl-CoA synthetase
MPRDAVRWGTNGRPVEGVLVRIVDPLSGLDMPTGERGEIWLLGLIRFKGYWRRPEATAQALHDGWMRTGDIGSLDEDGYLTFVGRVKEVLKVWSYSVFPEEVEAILATHPDVRQAAVVGCPDADRGTALQAYVVLEPKAAMRHHGSGRCATGGLGSGHGAGNDLAGRQLIAWCEQNMSHYKVPRTVVFCDELPSGCNGKLLRDELTLEAQRHDTPGFDDVENLLESLVARPGWGRANRRRH